jgi:O-antigen/teichoic acid export membrane protein
LSALGDAVDKVMIGKVLGAASLGYYGLAFTLSNLPATNISSLVNQITFPAFSKVQNDRAMLKNAFIKTLSHVSIISMPVAFGILAVAENLVVVVCGRKWLPAVPLIKILVFYGMSLSISSLAGPIFKAIGKPNVMLYTSILHHFIKISLLFLLIGYGAVGICYAVVIPLFLSSVIAFVLVAHYLELTTTEIIKPISTPIVCSVAMFGAIKIFEISIKANAALPLNTLLLSSITLGIGAYLVAAFFVSRPLLVEFKNTLSAVIRSKGKLV